jgi:hypothetical protein
VASTVPAPTPGRLHLREGHLRLADQADHHPRRPVSDRCSAARRLGGSAARRLGGSAARRLGGRVRVPGRRPLSAPPASLRTRAPSISTRPDPLSLISSAHYARIQAVRRPDLAGLPPPCGSPPAMVPARRRDRRPESRRRRGQLVRGFESVSPVEIGPGGVATGVGVGSPGKRSFRSHPDSRRSTSLPRAMTDIHFVIISPSGDVGFNCSHPGTHAYR